MRLFRLVTALILSWLGFATLPGCGDGGDGERTPPASGDPTEGSTTKSGAARLDPSFVVSGTGSAQLVDDAATDGWSTEVLSSRTVDRLWKLLGERVESGVAFDAAAATELCTADILVHRLVAGEWSAALVDEVVSVQRQPTSTPELGRGPESLVRAVAELAALFEGLDRRHVKLKQFEVTADAEKGSARTRLYLQMSGASPAANLQLHATWSLEWRIDDGTSPRLAKIEVSDSELVRIKKAEGPLFSDITESVLGGNAIFDRQIRPGVDHWTARLDASSGLDVGGWQGLSVADVNGDGLDDVYVCQPGGLPNRLFVQQADGTTEETSAVAGVDWIESTHGALFADIDNDGDQDLLVGVSQGVLIHENDGQGKFTVRVSELIPAAIPYSIASADYDEDGDLDFFVCCYNRRKTGDNHLLFARPVPYHDANNGGRNVFLQNDGGWKFSHATKRVGLDVNNRRFSYAAAWEDYDDDGDLDLYVANDFGRNNLYRNDPDPGGGRRFVDVAGLAGVEDISPGMSACWGDFDGDARVDLYVSNMFSSAGKRITNQERFHSGASATLKSQLRRHARGNSLFRNLGDGRFDDVSVESGVVLGRWAWGSKFVDLNSDGWEDLVVTNGFITQESTADL